MELLAAPHHDGSELYAPAPPAELGDETTVLLRVPRAHAADSVAVRYVRDGEPKVSRSRDRSRDGYRRLVARDVPRVEPGHSLPLAALRRRLRLRLAQRRGLQTGTCPTRTTSWPRRTRAGRIGTSSPSSTRSSRTASPRSGLTSSPPAWAVPREWDDLPTGRGPETPFEWFGGDLAGLEQRLDHIADARRERHLPDPDLPRRQHASLRRDDLRCYRSAARR